MELKNSSCLPIMLTMTSSSVTEASSFSSDGEYPRCLDFWESASKEQTLMSTVQQRSKRYKEAREQERRNRNNKQFKYQNANNTDWGGLNIRIGTASIQWYKVKCNLKRYSPSKCQFPVCNGLFRKSLGNLKKGRAGMEQPIQSYSFRGCEWPELETVSTFREQKRSNVMLTSILK